VWLSIIGLVHLTVNYFLNINSLEHLLPNAYLANYLAVIFGYFFLMYAKEKGSYALGYIFLSGFLVKMAIFMLFFKSTYKADGDIIPQEFFAFFVSYAFCLIYEARIVVKILNNS
jgi:hypothetical protein